MVQSNRILHIAFNDYVIMNIHSYSVVIGVDFIATVIMINVVGSGIVLIVLLMFMFYSSPPFPSLN